MEKPKLLITGAKGLIGNILWEGFADAYNLYGVDVEGGDDKHILESICLRIGSVRGNDLPAEIQREKQRGRGTWLPPPGRFCQDRCFGGMNNESEAATGW